MRVKLGSTRIDISQIDSYRSEETSHESVVRVFFGGGGSICINPKFEEMTLDDILKKIDASFFEEQTNEPR